jgi:hypothetical protein
MMYIRCRNKDQPSLRPAWTRPCPTKRLLLLDGELAIPAAEGVRRAGALLPLLEYGLAQASDMLRHRQPRLNRTHEAIITPDGWVKLPDGRVYAQPSPALKAQTGVDINRWGQHTHVPTGCRLQDLRKQAAERSGK